MDEWRCPLRAGIVAVCVLALVASVARAQDEDEEDEDQGPASPPAHVIQPNAGSPAPAAKTPTQGWGARPASSAPEQPAPKAPAPEARRTPKIVNPEEAGPAGDQGYLQGYAQSTSPNEQIHTVQKKVYTASGRFEATLYPAALQLNSKFVNTDGLGVGLSYAFQENMAVQLLGIYNYASGETSFTQNLLNLHARPEAADALSLDYGAIAAYEVAPIYGKFAFYDGSLVQFRFVLNAGAGMGKTQVQLTPGPPTGTQAQYGDAGWRFLGNLGAGFRLLIGERFALRLEVRDLIYTARVDRINGCNVADVTSIIGNEAPASPGCSANSFNPQQAVAATVAQNLLQDVSSDVLNNVIFFGGASILF